MVTFSGLVRLPAAEVVLPPLSACNVETVEDIGGDSEYIFGTRIETMVASVPCVTSGLERPLAVKIVTASQSTIEKAAIGLTLEW